MFESTKVLVVVAHPDDEILWFAPLASVAATVVVALPIVPDRPGLTRARELVRAGHPTAGLVFLPLSEAGVYRRSNWRRRRLTTEGVRLRGWCPRAYRRRYAANYHLLLEELDVLISQHDVVYTHNPWGEYGHEEHVQVCHAVMEVARRHHRSVWVWDGLSVAELVDIGCRTRSDYYDPLPPGLAQVELPVDLAFYQTVRELYQRHAAWTWTPTYVPPMTCRYVEIVRTGVALIDPCPTPVGRFRLVADLFRRQHPTNAHAPHDR